MKRHITMILVALLLVTAVFTLAACKGTETTKPNTDPSDSVGEDGTHQHSYSDKWTVDAEYHWHLATCTAGEDCKNAVASKAAHVDENNDKLCDVCDYDYQHVHSYTTEYVADENGHCKEPTCGCNIPSVELSAHVDQNNDGACDVCGYDGGHEHTFEENAWSADEKKHWHKASCGHSVKEDEESHDFNDVGICDVCGYNKNEMTVKNAVSVGEYYDSLVNGGKIVFGYDSYSPNYSDVEFKFGPGVAQ